MSCPIQFNYETLRYITDQREKYIDMFTKELYKGNFNQYLLAMIKYFTQQWKNYHNMALDFNDLSFYIRARFFRCTESDRFNRLDKFYSDYSLVYLNKLLDTLNYKKLHLILAKGGRYGSIDDR